jgi:hypothetical protein
MAYGVTLRVTKVKLVLRHWIPMGCDVTLTITGSLAILSWVTGVDADVAEILRNRLRS